MAGKARQSFEWRDHQFAEGDLFMLDLYGTCHDEASWENPMAFWPERFLGWQGDPFTMIPQGGGGTMDGHRCAGEWATIEVMKAMVRTLVRDIDDDISDRDLSIDLTQIPAVPKGGLRAQIQAVRG